MSRAGSCAPMAASSWRSDSVRRARCARLPRRSASTSRTSFPISPASHASSYYPRMGNDRCLFCRIASGEITAKKVYEDGDVVAFHDINPQAPTHVLVVPRKHIPTLDEMNEADAATVGTVLLRAAQIARDLQLTSDGYRIVINTGEAAGQTVFHIHFHILGGRNFGWPPG